METIKSITLAEQLKAKGFLVSSKKWGGWDNGNRMITDLKGVEIGFFTPIKCYKKFLGVDLLKLET